MVEQSPGPLTLVPAPAASLRRPRASLSASPKAVLAPSAILQPRQQSPKMPLLLPEAGQPALSPGHSPPPEASGPPSRVRTTHLPPTSFPTQRLSTPVPTVSLLGTLKLPSLLQGELLGTPKGPRPATGPDPCWHLGALYASGSHWPQPDCSQCWCEVGVRVLGCPGRASGVWWWLQLLLMFPGWGGNLWKG